MDAAIVNVWIRLTSAGEMCGICSVWATGLVLGYAEPKPASRSSRISVRGYRVAVRACSLLEPIRASPERVSRNVYKGDLKAWIGVL